MKIFFLHILLLLGITSVCTATHIVGGEIYYECKGAAPGGGYTFDITLKVYRDCGPSNTNNTPFDNPAYIAVYNSSGTLLQQINVNYPGAKQVPVVINNPCLAVPPQVCVEEAIYKTTQVLNIPSGGIDLVYQRCCRNPTIVNIVNPGQYGATYVTHIPDKVNCNSSPRFKQFPPVALCVGERINFDHSGIDPDGDSLVYELCRPYHGGTASNPKPNPPTPAPYSNIVWGMGYSDNYQMDASPAMKIDPKTGLLDGVPTKVGQYVVGVSVKEYRNGQLLGITRRDFQFNVVQCNMNIISAISNQTVFCDGKTVSFQNNSTNASFWHWDFGDPLSNADTSSQKSPTYTYVDTGVYTVTLIANPGWPCADTAQNTFAVYPYLNATYIPPPDQCVEGNSFDFKAGGTFGVAATFLWDFGPNANPQTSSAQNPNGVSFSTVGAWPVKLSIFENNCHRDFIDTVETWPQPTINFAVPKKEGCAPLGVQFNDSSTAGTKIHYTWDFGDGSTSTYANPFHVYEDPGDYDVSLQIKTTEGCVDTLTLSYKDLISVHPVPTSELSADPEEVWIFEPTIDFFGNASGQISCELHTGDGTVLPGCGNNTYTYKDTGNYYAHLIAVNEFECYDTAWVKIRITPVFLFYAPNAFTPDGDGLNDEFKPKVTAARTYDFSIYDRWGHVLFHTNDTEEGWNGTYLNQGDQIVQTGVYQFLANIEDVNGEYHTYTGNVHLLK